MNVPFIWGMRDMKWSWNLCTKTSQEGSTNVEGENRKRKNRKRKNLSAQGREIEEKQKEVKKKMMEKIEEKQGV